MKKITLILFALIAFCWQSNAQFTEGFDTEIPASWTVLNEDGGTYTWTHQTQYPQAGAGHARIHWEGSAHDDYLISPQFAVTAGVSDQIAFFAGIDGTFWTETFDVRISTTGATAADFTTTIASETVTTDADGDYTQYIYDLSAYDGQSIYVAIVATDTDRFYLYIDEFTVEAIPDCAAPTSIMVSLTGLDTSDITWTAGDIETDWTYEYGVSPYVQGGGGTSGTVMTTPSLSLSSLTAGETYDIYIQANCGGDGDSVYASTSWTQPNIGESCADPFSATVETDCSTAMPLSLDFDTGGSETLPSCDLSGNNGYWVELTTPANGAMNINLGGTATGVGVAIYDVCDGTEVFCNNNTLGATTELTGFAASTIYYLYFWQDTAGGVAEVCFEEISCIFPSNLSVNVTSATSADISWDENNSPASTAWEYVVQDPGTGEPAIAGTMTSSNPTSLTGLTDGSDYEFYVRADCGGSFSVWSGPFTWSQILPPANNDCANATALTVNGDLSCTATTSGTILGATASGEDEAACGGTEDDDVWYSFVATAEAHSVNLLNAAGSTADLYHSVWSGTCGALTNLSCSDPNSSSVSGLTIGNTYLLRVYTWTSTSGQTTTFDVCIGTLPSAPANDNCANAEALTVNGDLSCTATTSGTITSATASGEDEASCGGTEDDDVWYSFVAMAETHTIDLLNVVGSTTDLYHSVWSGTCGALTNLSCSDPNSSTVTGLTIGNSYLLRVYSWTSTAGQTTSFDVCIGTLPPPPSNDECANATVVSTLPYNFTQDASGATNNAGFIDPTDASCSGNGMNDGVWYTFTPSADGTVDISITNVVGWDPEVAIYSGACGAFICEGRADGAGGSGDETLSAISVSNGVQYWINVGYWSDSSDSAEGPFQIDISSVTLGIDDVDNQAAFSYYPNPVKNTLTLKAQNTIELVSMYNMLGQEVLRATPNNVDSDLDMSNLQTGTYFVKVTIANVTKTIRVIKQ